MGIRIISTGSSHPKLRVTNNDFTRIETSDEWIYTRTGIKQRYFAKDETTSSLAIEAGLKAINKANINPNDINLVIVATMTPDSFTPAVASKILAPLGIKQAMAFDMNVACAGFVYALNTASSLINDGYALVIGSECVSKLLDMDDRTTCVLFGDGAGAVLIEKSKNKSLFYASSKTDENHILESHGLSSITEEKELKDFKLKMNGTEVFKFALDAFNDCFIELNKFNINIDDINLIIPHQANKRIIQSVMRRFSIDEDKFYLNLESYGNTSSASIAIALDEAFPNLKKGMKILLIGFGSGLSWGYCLLEV